jgi:hypothetical protein
LEAASAAASGLSNSIINSLPSTFTTLPPEERAVRCRLAMQSEMPFQPSTRPAACTYSSLPLTSAKSTVFSRFAAIVPPT